MESLVGATLDPPVSRSRSKALPGGVADFSKGAGEIVEADWQRFHEAAQRRINPARILRSAGPRASGKSKRREALLARLAAFEAGHNGTSRLADGIRALREESKQQWRSILAGGFASGQAHYRRELCLTSSLQGRSMPNRPAKPSNRNRRLIDARAANGCK